MTKIERIPAWQLTKVKNKSEVIADELQKDTLHVTNGIIFFVCSTSTISALSLLLQEFQLD